MCTSNPNYLIEALETVLAWELPDEAIPDAVSNQFRLKAGIDPEDSWEQCQGGFNPLHH